MPFFAQLAMEEEIAKPGLTCEGNWVSDPGTEQGLCVAGGWWAERAVAGAGGVGRRLQAGRAWAVWDVREAYIWGCEQHPGCATGLHVPRGMIFG
jgi:hypothetical protein